MNQTEQSNRNDRFTNWLKNSITLRMITIGMMILLLLIPIGMVSDLIRERESRKYDAIQEISSIWGGDQLITGPEITIPYTVYEDVHQPHTNTMKTLRVKKFAHFLPEQLNINSSLNPEIRYRGIYEAIVYQAEISVEGVFLQPDMGLLNIDPDHVLWDEATLSIGISDLRSIKDEVKIKLGDHTLSFDPGIPTQDISSTGITTSLKGLSNVLTGTIISELSFEIHLQLNGSNSLNFVPVGKKTNINIESTWPDPSFIGAFLPNEKSITENGFAAKWEVFHLNRPFSQQFKGPIKQIHQSTFGVNLFVPVNDYQQSTRAIKYAVLLITLTFIMFFFAQVIRKENIHPIQYLIVGFAICLFYTLLVALSEHIGFQKGYMVASIATLSAIIMYIQGFFKSNQMTMLTGALLGVIYAFIYIIIQLQDYALLMGSIGLFVILASIMFYTRKIDWKELKNEA